jgi:hypothetical protein
MFKVHKLIYQRKIFQELVINYKSDRQNMKIEQVYSEKAHNLLFSSNIICLNREDYIGGTCSMHESDDKCTGIKFSRKTRRTETTSGKLGLVGG